VCTGEKEVTFNALVANGTAASERNHKAQYIAIEQCAWFLKQPLLERNKKKQTKQKKKNKKKRRLFEVKKAYLKSESAMRTAIPTYSHRIHHILYLQLGFQVGNKR
jgi:hypothetical protein